MSRHSSAASDADLNGHAGKADTIGVHTAIAALENLRPNGRDKRRAFIARTVPISLKTDHPLVDQFATVRLQGIMVDRSWLKSSKFCSKRKGKDGETIESDLPCLVAILVFADLVDWYRSHKDRVPGQTLPSARKKFSGAWLVKTFESWAGDLGLSKGQVQDAVYLLKKAGLLDYREASQEVRAQWKSGDKSAERPFEIWPIASEVKELCGAGAAPRELGLHYRTGNAVCDELFFLKLRGDVIDFNWLHHPALRHGKLMKIHLTALFVMAHLFYMHSPFEPTDPVTHEPLKMQKRFKNEVLSKDYETWAKFAGLTEDQLRRAVAFLVTAELIERETGTETTVEGFQTNLRAMITPHFDAVFDLTFGPFPSKEERERALRGDRKALKSSPFSGRQKLPKFAETSGQLPLEPLPLESLRTPPEIRRDSPVEPSESPEICRDRPSKFAETTSRNLQTIIETYPVAVRDQQQQCNEKSPVTDFGGVGLDAYASPVIETDLPSLEVELAARREAVVETLIGFGTGCATDVIRKAALTRIEHAEMWAQWWPHQPEADEEFWIERGSGDTARGLSKRLTDPAQIPPQVRQERARAKKRDGEAERRREQREAKDEQAREEREVFAYQRKVAGEVLQRFSMQPEGTRRAAIAQVGQVNQFLRDRSPGRDLRKLVERALSGGMNGTDGLLFTLTSELGAALDHVIRERPQLPGLEQRAAGEEFEHGFDDEFGEEGLDAAPLPISLIAEIQAGNVATALVRELVREVQDGRVKLDGLDRLRDINYELDEWEAIKERVAAALAAGEGA